MRTFLCLLAATAAASAEPIEEIVVTSERRPSPELAHIGNVAVVESGTIRNEAHVHLHELMLNVPGVWISRGSGQENLTAIRSPVLAGAGSCGAFLTLEDGIPTRPAGFCNVNQAFELYSEAASTIEVLRGPGNALYGSNALHGTINLRMPAPSAAPLAAVELGANDFRRARLRDGAAERWLLDASLTDDGGFRDDTGFRQAKLHARIDGDWLGGRLATAITATDLDQETAGFILGEDAYRDPAVNRSNPNPEAFRRAESQRLYATWQRDFGGVSVDLRPFLRHSDMVFLQHFLPGQPREENGHTSAGVLLAASFRRGDARIIAGLDLEWADVFLVETQDGPTEGSAFLVETRPQGRHYDYAVRSLGAAPYLQAFVPVGSRVELSAGLRAESIRYDYDNRMLTGNTRDDGSSCGFGGCLYTRPADRSDRFDNIAPKLGLSVVTDPASRMFASLARGFRAPQMTELYRLQNGQSVSDLDSETIDAAEIGWRHVTPASRAEFVVFAMRKKDSVLRDAEGFNISAGRSRHEGVEFSVDRRLGEAWSLRAAGSYARHTYDFDLVAERGETFVSGRDVDTAPRVSGMAALSYAAAGRWSATLQLNVLGDYYLDAENRFRYPGHELVNLYLSGELSPALRVNVRLRNLFDEAVADRADFAFGDYRYFPGRGRELFVELVYRRSRN